MTPTRTLRTIGTGLLVTIGVVALSATPAPTVHTSPIPVVCDQLASWPQVLATHGEDEAHALWADLAAQGWTNPRSGDVALLVQPGCADS